MAGRKTYLGYHVLTGARARISAIFENFPKVYVSFSGGKDSTVMFHLCAEEARRIGRKFGVLFIDWECQYRLTIDHVREMLALYSDVAEPYWCCVPLKTVNAVSVFEPEWIAWENGKEWIREKPDISIKDGSYFPFYRYAMTFEEFVPAFGRWYSGNVPTACFVGIRTDESLNRWTTIAANRNKQTYRTGAGPPAAAPGCTTPIRFTTGPPKISGPTAAGTGNATTGSTTVSIRRESRSEKCGSASRSAMSSGRRSTTIR